MWQLVLAVITSDKYKTGSVRCGKALPCQFWRTSLRCTALKNPKRSTWNTITSDYLALIQMVMNRECLRVLQNKASVYRESHHVTSVQLFLSDNYPALN